MSQNWNGPEEVFGSWENQDLRTQVVASLVRRGFLVPPSQVNYAKDDDQAGAGAEDQADHAAHAAV